MKRYFILIFSLLFLLENGKIDAQAIIDDKLFEDPNVSKFNIVKAGTNPTFKGSVNITLPLMSVLGRGGLNYDITLNYVSSNGVPAGQSATWVGLGWNLNTYQITCTPVIQNSAGGGGYGDINKNDLYTVTYPGGSTDIYNFGDVENPDWRTLNWSNIKIDEFKDAGTTTQDYTKFIITDLDGTKYVYGNVLLKLANNSINNHSGTREYQSVFKLTEIRDPNFYDTNGDGKASLGDVGNWIKLNYSVKIDLFQASSDGQMEVNYLESIETPTHIANFECWEDELKLNKFLGEGLKYLNCIKLEDRTGTMIKKVTFNMPESCSIARYREIGAHDDKPVLVLDTGDPFNARKVLESVEFEGQNGEKIPSYKFSYYDGPEDDSRVNDLDSFTGAESYPLPYLKRFGIDIWGYCSIEDPESNSNVTNLNHETEPYWMIKTITYPTGGTVSYEYESNRYLCFYSEGPQYGGGVRLKKEIVKDVMTGKESEYNYEYSVSAQGTAFEGNGIISSDPYVYNGIDFHSATFVGESDFSIHYPDVKVTNPDGGAIIKYFTASVSMFDVGDYLPDVSCFQKSYETVTHETDPYFNSLYPSETAWNNSIDNYYKSYFKQNNFYEDMRDFPSSTSYTSSFDAFSKEIKEFDGQTVFEGMGDLRLTRNIFDNNWKRGHVVREEYLNDIGDIVQSKKYYYTMVPKISSPYLSHLSQSMTSDELYVPSTITSGWARLDEVETIQFDENGISSISSSVENEYDNPTGLVVKTTETNSDNTKRITDITYAYSLTQYSDMLNYNMLRNVAQKTVKNGSNEPRSSTVTTWKKWNNLYWAHEGTYGWLDEDGTYSLPDFNFSNPATSEEWRLLSKNLTRDVYGNILTAKNANDIVTSITWGHNSSRPLTKSIDGNLITTMGYDASTLQLTSVTDENNNTTYYNYDDLGRLETIKDNNQQTLVDYTYYYSRNGNTVFTANDPNYVETRSYRDTDDYTTTKSYSNSLGLAIQQQTSLGNDDIVVHTEYDKLQRPEYVYKAYQKSGLGHNYDPLYETNAETAYGNYPYSEIAYLKDPLGRVKNEAFPGDNFYMGSGHEINYQYLISGNNLKNSIEDENGNLTDNYVDLWGNTVKTVVDPSGLALATLFEYDILGNLTKSTPPEGSGYETTYRYNTLGQLIARNTPDEDGNGDGNSANETAESATPDYEYLYDKVGNLRFILDPNGRNNEYYIYNKYDAQNRLIESGRSNETTSFTPTNAINPGFTPAGEIYIVNKYDTEPTSGSGVWADLSDPGTMNNLEGRLAASAYKDINTGEFGYTLYSYDHMGNIKILVQDLPGVTIGSKKIEYQYDWGNNLTHVSYQNGQSDQFYCWYEYDDAGRLERVLSSREVNYKDAAEVNAEYFYEPNGQFRRVVYGETAQGIDYRYNSRDWLTQINHQNLDNVYQGEPQDPGRDGFDSGVNADVFGMVIGYENLGHVTNTPNHISEKQYNGNISWMMWQNKDLSTPYGLVGYTFQYDKNNRLKEADFAYHSGNWQETPHSDVTGLDYDKNGNILSLDRYYSFGAGAQLDGFTYNYKSGTNKLDYVSDIALSSLSDMDIDNQSLGNYSYDMNGNLISDVEGGVSSIEYGRSNLQNKMTLGLAEILTLMEKTFSDEKEIKAKQEIITEGNVIVESEADVQFRAGISISLKPGFKVESGGKFSATIVPELQTQEEGDIITYAYDAGGQRVHKLNSNGAKSYYIRGANGETLAHYAYEDDTETINLISLNLFGADLFGRYSDTDGYSYYIKDHLGSTRAVVDEDGYQIEAYDYYPYGKIMRAVESSSTVEKFTGKEFDNDSNEKMYYFGARYLSADLGRWMTVDPLADMYPGWSPYNYTGGNPINRIDPNGMDWYSQTDSNGVVSYHYNADLNSDNSGDILGEGQEYVGVGFMNIDNSNPFYSSTITGDANGNVTTTLSGKQSLAGLQLIMEGFGVVPVIGDAVDGLSALMYLSQGDIENAGYAAAAMIPFAGNVKLLVKWRKAIGADGGLSRHLIEVVNGKTNSKIHQVFNKGGIIHQHQNHIGKYGSERQFPQSWLKYKDK